MSIKLVTERLSIEPFTKQDACRTKKLADDEKLAMIIGLPHPYKLKFAEEWIKRQPELMKNGVEYPLKIVSKEICVMIGTITLRIDQVNHKGELGYWIGSEFWGNGFATEAVNKVIEFGFMELDLHKICASVICRNYNSIKVLEKSGLYREGMLRQDKRLLGKYEDIYVYGILKTEYLRTSK